ncbi:hypothetical protein TrVGV298_005028 [Trichoderma virens]|nr:hypothetical protein TrVGV298_005028 [Trichoderma virens]
MKWYIGVIALYGATAVAFPGGGVMRGPLDVQEEACTNNQEEGGGCNHTRGICSSDKCCCQCIRYDGFPCVGCVGFIVCPLDWETGWPTDED